MKVNVDEIRTILNLLLDKLKESKGNIIVLNNDYYWNIWDNELYNPNKKPEGLTLGQLSSDLDDLNMLYQSQAEDATIYDLKKMSEILKALSHENPIAF